VTAPTRALQFARDLAEPDWSLSVPVPAKRSIAKLLAAVDATLALHKEDAIYECDDNGFPQTEDESKFVRNICGTCSDSSVTENLDDGNYDISGEYGEVGWPCPTVEAINKALEAEQ